MTTSTSLTEVLGKLKEPFPREVIRTVKKGGASLSYIPVSEVIARLNREVGNWSIVESTCHIDALDPTYVIGKVTLEVKLWDERLNDYITRRHIGFGGQKIKNLKSGEGTVDLGDEFKGAQSDAFKKAAQQLGIGLDLARTDEALAYDAQLDAEPASEAQIAQIDAYVKSLDAEGEDMIAFKAWWKRNIGKRLAGGDVTADEAQGAILKFNL